MNKSFSSSELMLMGRTLAKVWYWSHRYQLSFQFWGKDNNNLYISKYLVEIASFGGETTVGDILEVAIEWCEKSFPNYKYPAGLETTEDVL